jgi:AraC family transcriptional activator of pobA
MQKAESYLDIDKQNDKLTIRLVTPGFGHLPPEVVDQYGFTHRKTHYFFLFMLDGHSRHSVDLQPFDIGNNQLLFILPHQIHKLPEAGHGTDYYKIGFDESCLSLLPKQYPFLLNPFNNQKLEFTPPAAVRIRAVFEILHQLLSKTNTEPELILAHLNSLLTEINAAYFSADKSPAGDKLNKYIGFKTLIESTFSEQPSVIRIAGELATNPNSLYKIVKQYSGLSPKEFITNRLVLEAKRRLYYGESSSIKELAFVLGFNDPEYFSRLFKKATGKTITAFRQDLSGI